MLGVSLIELKSQYISDKSMQKKSNKQSIEQSLWQNIAKEKKKIKHMATSMTYL